jgi:hypothetical protein
VVTTFEESLIRKYLDGQRYQYDLFVASSSLSRAGPPEFQFSVQQGFLGRCILRGELSTFNFLLLALDAELAEVMIYVLVHQLGPFLWG